MLLRWRHHAARSRLLERRLFERRLRERRLRERRLCVKSRTATVEEVPREEDLGVGGGEEEEAESWRPFPTTHQLNSRGPRAN